MSLAEILGVATGALAIVLIARESVWGWPVSIVSSALYIVVFYRARLYADSGLQACYIVLCAYGWAAWVRRAVAADHTLRVRRASAPKLAAALALGVAASGLLYLALARTDAALPWLDAPTAAFSLVGQWMQARKWIENWPLWIAVDLVYVGLYVLRSLYLTAALYGLFALLAVMGWLAWRRTLAASALLASSS